MKRRGFLVLGLGAAAARARSARAQAGTIDQLLQEYDSSSDILENAWLYRDRTVSRGVGHGSPSTRKISALASDVILRLEVGGKERYEKLYQGAVWPRGRSGATVGIGYDLGQSTATLLRRDWGQLVSAEAVETLQLCLGLQGPAANACLPRLRGVQIPWTAAVNQYEAYLPYAVADTERAFTGNTKLLSDDSMGALVSLVYNRGGGQDRRDPNRREMVEIHDLMVARNFTAIPARIRSMKRLWTTADSRGLVIRREIEAKLFESGLA